ncbi:YmfL family putative regulatory protein [Klebsiella sp. PL-2018]|uniref:YmfL family putative regulatory protein n=1 Tax=Klebsiella sp. PL-2018 TaxID=2851540 RepID=UPI001C2330F8|nr:YmfL family putative regulatory protein [Klebsiella sp. PL-2018]QXC99349.1 Orf33 [Klebsiella sp. PL-2018]
MVDSINTAVSLMCKAHKRGRQGMAGDLGMTFDVFNNHLYQRCGSRFFTHAELERMEDLSGTSYFTEYQANRKGKLLVDIPKPGSIDKVDLYDIEMKALVAAGQLASAKIAAEADGVIDHREHKTLSNLFNKTLRHQIHGFLGFLALYGVGVADHAVDMFVMAGREVDAPSLQLEASVAPII